MPDCVECRRLIEECTRREREYVKAVAALTAEETQAADFMSFRVIAEEARVDTEFARLELQHHLRRHSQK